MVGPAALLAHQDAIVMPQHLGTGDEPNLALPPLRSENLRMRIAEDMPNLFIMLSLRNLVNVVMRGGRLDTQSMRAR